MVILSAQPICIGVDFSSAPDARKSIWLARGECRGKVVWLHSLQAFDRLDGFAAALREPLAWVGAFDFPFGLPRELVEALDWPTQWLPLMRHYQAMSRAQIRATFKAFCDARPVGAKFAHRACDRPAGSSPSMKWVNPPVALMLHAGVPLLIDAGVLLPALHDGDPSRVALEGYPGLLARELIGRRSYKSDDRKRWHDAARRLARGDIVEGLCGGRTRLALTLQLPDGQRAQLIDDGTGDRLDAVLCLMQAAWSAGQPNFGLPVQVDPIEGWIVSA